MSLRSKPKGGVEYRQLAIGGTSAAGNGLQGVGIRYGSPTQIGQAPWGFQERFAPGAFADSLASDDVLLLDNHDMSKPLARKSAGTVSFAEGDALRWDAPSLPDTSYARDVLANVRCGNYGGCSVGFVPVGETWFDDDGNISDGYNGTVREVQRAKLIEVSVCTLPAYGDTSVSARDAASAGRLAEYRAKYDAAELAQMLKDGNAFKNANGEPSYPIADAEDLENAVHAVGRGGSDHNAIRAYIMSRAKALGLPDKIPDGWSADGSAGGGEGKAASPGAEARHATAATDAAHSDAMHECLAPIDATLDEALAQAAKVDRNSLPAEINQMIDLVKAAAAQVAHQVGKLGEPDPDKPNGNTYASNSSAADDGNRTAVDMREYGFRHYMNREAANAA